MEYAEKGGCLKMRFCVLEFILVSVKLSIRATSSVRRTRYGIKDGSLFDFFEKYEQLCILPVWGSTGPGGVLRRLFCRADSWRRVTRRK